MKNREKMFALENPVRASDGRVYERKWIESFFKENPDKAISLAILYNIKVNPFYLSNTK